MHAPDHVLPPFARTDVMWALARNGGSVRMGALLKLWTHSLHELYAIINELERRRWLRVSCGPQLDARVPKPFSRIDRIVATRWGRSRMVPLPRRTGPQRQGRP
jgi:hypothetical protein